MALTDRVVQVVVNGLIVTDEIKPTFFILHPLILQLQLYYTQIHRDLLILQCIARRHREIYINSSTHTAIAIVLYTDTH